MNRRSEAASMVHVVDDDAALRASTCALLGTLGYRTVESASGDAFLEHARDGEPGCVILDLEMPGMRGLEVLQAMQERATRLSFVVVTGHADVRTAVAALKLGASDLLEKPYQAQALVAAVEQGIAQSQGDRPGRSHQARRLIATLTPRECQVLHALVAGGSNKIIAADLGLSPRTVEMHRANLMDKLSARSLSDVVRLACDAGLRPAH